MADETRMLTSSTPLARARQRATGVIGQLKRLLTEKAGFDPRQAAAPSPALAEAISEHAGAVASRVDAGPGGHDTVGEVVVYDDAAVEQALVDLRQRSIELKKKAATTSEKATIEIVALMFQSILSEERIPPAVRVWFARLQMPVLRVALAEPEFFGTLEHPARQLIDRMGSCVLGFECGGDRRQRAGDRDQARRAGDRAVPRDRPPRVPAGVRRVPEIPGRSSSPRRATPSGW